MQTSVEANQEQGALLREAEAGNLLGLSVHAMQARRQKGVPPRYLKIGRSVRYRRHDIESYLQSCIVEGKA